MKCTDIHLLRCPICKKPLSLLTINAYYTHSEDIRSGEVKCTCSTYRINEGIVILKKYIAKEFPFTTRIAYATVLYLQKVFHLSFNQCMSLMTIFSLYPAEKKWFRYLAHREKRASFLLQKSLATSIKGNNTIVDLGCGGGNLISYLMKKNNHIYTVDQFYWLMYLAKITNHIDHSCTCIVADLEKPFPFSDNSFDAILSNDCLMYITNQNQFLHETLRIKKKEAAILLAHIHKKGAKNPAQGKGMEPKNFALFGKNMHIFDDKYLWNYLTKKTIRIDKIVSSHTASFSVLIHVDLHSKKNKIITTNIDFEEDQNWETI